MIHLTKGQVPKILVDHAASWTAELAAAISAGSRISESRKRRYNNAEIKEAIVRETHGKCAYCESKVCHISYGDIEHIIPKAANPALTYDWANLTLACDICNTKKGDTGGLVDPYETDPEETQFRFMGPMVTIVPGSEPAKFTLALLGLNRPELIEKRKEKVDDLGRRLEEIVATRDPGTRNVLIKALVEEETSAVKEFTACARAYVQDKKRDGVIPIQ